MIDQILDKGYTVKILSVLIKQISILLSDKAVERPLKYNPRPLTQ